MNAADALAQRQDALERANAIRSYRSQLKRDLKAGRRHVLALLNDPPPQIATMKVAELLLAVPKVGQTKVKRALSQCDISPSRTVQALSVRQRYELGRLLVATRQVGICAACGTPLVRLANDDEAASCECGAASIPHAFIDANRRMATRDAWTRVAA